MMNNNKILTVSYGTFSCTLEGFDDSFDTMKAIAEYFRDLASDDRYFGAEPPQPDAEMLARIAEREVSRRVEAREHEGRIMLRAHEDSAPPATAATALAATGAAEITPPAPVPDTQAKSAPSDAETVPNTEAPAHEKNLEERIAEQTVQADAPEEQPEVQNSTPDVTEPVHVEEAAAQPEVHEAPAATVLETAQNEPADQETENDAAAFFADSSTSEPETEEVISSEAFTDFTSLVAGTAKFDRTDTQDLIAEDVDYDDVPETNESLADKLQRIRAVVATQDHEPQDDGYDEDTEEPATMYAFDETDQFVSDIVAQEEVNEIVAEAAQDITDALDADNSVEPENGEGEDLEGILRRLEAGEDDIPEDDRVDLAAETFDQEPTQNLFEEETNSEDQGDVLGRVLKVKRADLDAALDAGELEEYHETNGAAEDEGERDASNAQDDLDQATDTAAAREALPNIDEEAGEDVSRLMAEADQQMQEPEGKTRRSAFAHLRAAVAARFADRSMDDEAKQVEAEAEVYKSDLAEAVKPRRPIASETRSERPAEPRPAPLKLVAEQRIEDDEQAKARGPVAPRRVAAAADDDIDLGEDSGFADYAEERGAAALPELLEAAAAYLAYVEGHEQFSRPQLMARVRQADCGDFSREDGLRSFGQLLRTGKIEKIKGGRFTASESIGYKPGHRAVG